MGNPQPLIVWASTTHGCDYIRSLAPAVESGAVNYLSVNDAKSRVRQFQLEAATFSSAKPDRKEPLAEAFTSGFSEQSFETAPPAQLDHMPARSVEPPGKLARSAVGRDAIEALAIDVHHPQDVTERAERLLEESFPDVALVELRISHHRDEALGRACLPVVLDIA